ncbi:hypothetical protein [Falsiroseomonas sp. HW251]|uniref:hypothetical protein n=1 Tax=Falsiroseomonas sp. HW251 TaxID=3390998 RepID=UPI003D31D376
MAFAGFMQNVVSFFQPNNELLMDAGARFVVHSVKFREKDTDHLREKIARKLNEGRTITPDNIFSSITDFCGVRVLHLKLRDFPIIHNAIQNHLKDQHWALFEDPKAYTWDPEYKAFFEKAGIKTELKESFYTSVHYVVKPNPEASVTCEIQVRSLFEEVWGEIEHDLNYPKPSENLACREQLKVLAKIVGAGSRLIEAIYTSLEADGVSVRAPQTAVVPQPPPKEAPATKSRKRRRGFPSEREPPKAAARPQRSP